jgi:tetratricopeptide (TPR) repeat protein
VITKEDGFELHFKRSFPHAGRYGFACAALLLSLLIIYSNSFYCSWHFDDLSNIVNNVNVHLKTLSWSEIQKTFYYHDRIERPLAYFTFALNYYAGGESVFGYHVVNLLIHFISAWVLFLFIYSMLNLPLVRNRYHGTAYAVALLATLFWAWNPVQVHAVTYIVQRMASMAAMFHIMAMYFFLKGRTSDRTRARIPYFILCGACGLLAFASKQNAALLPLNLFLFDLFLIQGLTKETVKRALKFAAVPLLMVLAVGLFHVDLSSIGEAYENRPFTLVQRLLTEPRVLVFYVTLLFYPIGSRLALLHDVEISRSLLDPWTTLPAILIILGLVGTALALGRKRPVMGFCIIYFFLNHLVEGSVFALELAFEHRNYLPSMFLFVPLAVLSLYVLNYFSYRKSLQLIMALGVTVLLAAQGHTAFERNRVLRTDLTLWVDNVAKAPKLSRVHNNLGKVYWDADLYEDAVHAFKKALQLNRGMSRLEAGIVHYNLGQYHFYVTKDRDAALRQYRKSLKIYPHYPPAVQGVAKVQLLKGKAADAREVLQEAIAISPVQYRAQLVRSLSIVEFKMGQYGQCIRTAKRAMDMNPHLSDCLGIIAEAFKHSGQLGNAIRYWERFLEKSPKSILAHLALIELYHKAEQNDRLKRAVSRLFRLKGQKRLNEILCTGLQDSGIKAFTPDAHTLIPILKQHLLYEAQDLQQPLQCPSKKTGDG